MPAPATDFDRAVADLKSLQVRPEVALSEAPAPRRMAPEALALTAEIVADDIELGHGRLVVLHNPDGEDAWEGATRLVLYIDAAVEREMAADPMLPEVGWTWLEESLDSAEAHSWALGGTVTRVQSEPYGAMTERGPEGRLQIRASWTADLDRLAEQVQAWTDLLATACGLEPLPDGVALLTPRSAS